MGDFGFGDSISFAVRQLNTLDVEVPRALPTAVDAAAEELAVAVKAAAPRRSGKLANSVGAESVGADADSAQSRVVVKRFYARFVEYGTVKMPARPFLRSTADLKRRALGNTIKNNIKVIGVKIRSFKR